MYYRGVLNGGLGEVGMCDRTHPCSERARRQGVWGKTDLGRVGWVTGWDGASYRTIESKVSGPLDIVQKIFCFRRPLMRMIPRFRHTQLRSSQSQRIKTVQTLEYFISLPHASQILFVLVKRSVVAVLAETLSGQEVLVRTRVSGFAVALYAVWHYMRMHARSMNGSPHNCT